MRKLLKVLAAALALLLLVAAGLTVFIKIKFPPEKIKALVNEQVKKRLHRELRLGDVSVGLLHGLSLDKVQLSENPGFAAGTFLSADGVSVEPFLLPLLKGRLLIKRVSLDKPSVSVVRRADGRFNFSDLADAPAAAPASPKGGASPDVPLLVNAVSIEGGSFLFDDKTGGLKASVKDLSLHAAAFSLTAPFSADLACKVEAAPAGKPAVAGDVAFKGRLSLAQEGRVDIDRLAFSFPGASLEAKGAVRNFSAPDADLAVDLKEFQARALAPFAALPPALKDASLRGTVQLKGGPARVAVKASLKGAAAGVSAGLVLDAAVKDPAGTPSFDAALSLSDLTLDKAALPSGVALQGPLLAKLSAKGTPDQFAFTLEAEGKSAALSYGALFAKPAGTALALKAAGSVARQKDVTLSSARLTLADAVVDARGAVADAPGTGRLDLRVTAAPFDVAPFGKMVPPAAEYKLSGKVGADLSVTGTAAAPRVRGTLTLAGLAAVPLAGVRFDGLTGAAAFTEDSLDLPALQGKLNGETLSLKARVVNFSRPDVTAEGSLAALDLGKLQAAFAGAAPAPAVAPAAPAPRGEAPIAKARGSFRIASVTHPYYVGKDFAFTWDLSDLGPDLSRLGGTARLSASDGKIRNLPLADKVNKLLKRNGADITYSRLGGHAAIARGVLTTQDFAVDSEQMDISAKGSVNLVDTTADLRAIFKLAKGAVGGSTAEWFADENGRVTVEAAIKGPLTDPSITPDLSKAAARAASGYLKKALEKALGGGAPASGGAAQDGGAPAQDPKQKIAEEAQKALRNLFKKKQ